MNINNLHKIFDNYIENFELINDDSHAEYYKWEFTQHYIDNIKGKWDPKDKELYSKLIAFWKETDNFLDNSICQPLYGLISHVKPEQNPEEVCSMMEDLFADDGGDLKLRQKKIEDFIKRGKELSKEYSNGNWKYDLEQRTVMAFLFFNDPTHNYFYKATQAKNFADFVEYYNEWGSSSNFKLDVYYDMCDELVEEIKKYPPLLEINKLRFEHYNKKPLYKDEEYHLLAFDIIYCASEYGLANGVEYSKLNSSERKVIKEKATKATELLKEFNKANEDAEKAKEVQDYLLKAFTVGTKVTHKTFGKGVIKEINGTLAEFNFDGVSKKLDINVSVANSLISDGNKETEEYVKENIYYVKNVANIMRALDRATTTLMPYLDYLS